jgi:hypothetical protein
VTDCGSSMAVCTGMLSMDRKSVGDIGAFHSCNRTILEQMWCDFFISLLYATTGPLVLAHSWRIFAMLDFHMIISHYPPLFATFSIDCLTESHQ